MRHDITFPLYVEVDRIFNFACPASPIHYQFDPVQTTKTSVHGTINMLGLAKRVKARILQASTSEVYGDPEVHPQTEAYWGRVNPIGPRSCYDEGKRCAETLFFDYYRQHELDIKVVRIFNTYGPRMHPNDGRVVSNFIVQALKGDDITIYGNGQQTRSFCYVEDLIEGVVRMMNTSVGITGPINLGNPTAFTMLELAERILKLTQSQSKLTFRPLPDDDPKQRQPDINLASDLLGWKPKVDLEDGLRRLSLTSGRFLHQGKREHRMNARGTFHAPNARFSTGALSVAVLFLVFNRPDVTSRVFKAIRQARPPRLYIAADGPRAECPDEAEKCNQVRKIVSQIDWPCSPTTLFRSENLGCKRAVSSAIAWFFENEEEGIILEDDCLPSQSFFWFCQDLLRRYRDDTRVWQISGTAFLEKDLDGTNRGSYFFSKYGPIWGWASWRRAWKNYDPDLVQWAAMSEEVSLRSAYPDRAERSARKNLGDRLLQNEIDTWDYQWGIIKNYQSGLSIVPGRNMIVNLGFGPEATHTQAQHPLAATQSFDVRFPVDHPQFVLADALHDETYRRKLIVGRTGNILRKALTLLRRFGYRRRKL
jgi:UDP-glucuronate decarboxylase